MGTKYFVTRHAGAVLWASRKGLKAEKVEQGHFDVSIVKPGDVIIGTMPIHLVAEIGARGGEYWHLTMDVPAEARGRELSVDDMEAFGARLQAFTAFDRGPRASHSIVTTSGQALIAPDATHWVIASGQSLPNLLPLLHLPVSRVVLFATDHPASRKSVDIIATLLDKGAIPRLQGIRPKIVKVTAQDGDYAGLLNFFTEQRRQFVSSEARDRDDSHSLVVNITGGTKLLSGAMAIATAGYGIHVYCNTEGQHMIVTDPIGHAPIALRPDALDIPLALAAHSIRQGDRRQSLKVSDSLADLVPEFVHSADPDWQARAQARADITRALVEGYTALNHLKCKRLEAFDANGKKIDDKAGKSSKPSLMGVLSMLCSNLTKDTCAGAIHRARFQLLSTKKDDPRETSNLGKLSDLAEQLKAAGFGVLTVENMQLQFDAHVNGIDHGTRKQWLQYLGGIWVEEWAWLQAREAMLSLNITDIDRHLACGVKLVSLLDAGAQAQESGGADNEIDVILAYRNTVLVIECKVGGQIASKDALVGQEVTQKLDMLADLIGGTMGKSMLLSAAHLHPEHQQAIVERLQERRIRSLSGNELRDVKRVILQWLKTGSLGATAPKR